MSFALKSAPELERTDNERWQAVVARDTRYDGQFVFAVSSTRIYCRPSCPSRRPHRDRVSFFSLPEAAETAGFRACLRCEPKRARVLDPQIEMVQQVCRYLDSADVEEARLSDLAAKTGVSVFHLQRTFKNIIGVSPRQYLAAKRFGVFKTRVREGASITDALYDSGFNSSSRLYEQASNELGMTPATYGRSGKGIQIKYTIIDSPLGRLLVARTERGVCAVTMGERDTQLLKDLHAEFAQANINRDDAALRLTVRVVLDHLNNKQPHQDLPLDIRATAFQRLVWDKLRSIPFGQTLSYGEVAKSLGKPGAVRAVGRACATNPVALVIPCHRVVREDRSLGGYRWGLERKQKLLDQEKRLTKS